MAKTAKEIVPFLKPVSMSHIARAPRIVRGPLFNKPTTLFRFKLDLITARQNGAMAQDQSSRFIWEELIPSAVRMST